MTDVLDVTDVNLAGMPEQKQAGRGSGQRRAASVRGLLEHGSLGAGEPDHDSGEDPGRDLDYALDGWHVGVIAVAARAERDGQEWLAGQPGWAVRELAERVGCRLLCVERDEHSVWAWLGTGARLALADVERLLRRWRDRAARDRAARDRAARFCWRGRAVRVWRAREGVSGVAFDHRQAQAALLVARSRPRPCTRYGDVALLASALQDELLAGALIDVYIAPLRDARDGGAVLRQTLRAYLATERSVSSTAAALGVVRKTVANRLRTIEERLGPHCTRFRPSWRSRCSWTSSPQRHPRGRSHR